MSVNIRDSESEHSDSSVTKLAKTLIVASIFGI